ncbi:MAG: hypothetical protein ACFFCS_14425 [Candidatus Hodarchaeota archaeon]
MEKHIQFEDFLFRYASCPVCGKPLDMDRLRKVFYNPSNDEEKLLDFLLDSPDDAGGTRVGIPCCACFTRYFRVHEFYASLFEY